MAQAYNNRGLAYVKKGEHDKAIADYGKAIGINPKHARTYNSLAWLLATCPEPKYRNGYKAVDLARKALELEPESDKYFLDTLAAAHAEAGDFEAAISAQEKAIQLLREKGRPDEVEKKLSEYSKRLEHYKARKPWRETKP